jgi:hypothetical protein
MSLQPVYLVAIKNLGPFLEALRHAQAPEKLGLRFLEDLGFKSTNDRLFIQLLKAMKFLDEGGKPMARYHEFLDDTQWKKVLANGIKDAYSELFRVNKNAQDLTREQLTGKIKSLGEGKISPVVLGNMTRTFLELVKLADFKNPTQPKEHTPKDGVQDSETPKLDTDTSVEKTTEVTTSHVASSLVYRIEIVLPAVRDQAIYDAIFRSAKEHLLR